VTRSVRILACLAVSLILATTVFELILYVINIRIRHRAEALISAIEQLRLGESTLSDTQPLRIAYEATRNPDGTVGSAVEQSYSIRIANNVLNAVSARYPALFRFGLKPAFSDSGQPSELTTEVQAQQHSGFEEDQDYHIGVGTRPTSFPDKRDLGLVFTVVITAQAAAEQRHAAFGVRLSCLSSLGGCHGPCELLPLVWKDAQRRYEGKQITLLEDSRCSVR
jgi:hypothetical protein